MNLRRLPLLLLLSLAVSPAFACNASFDGPVPATDADAYGIPVAALDPSFVKVTALRRELFCDKATSKGAPPDLSGVKFRIDRDFNFDGKLDSAFVGTYADSAGGTGIFMAVVELLGEKGQQLLYLRKEADDPRVSRLSVQGDILSWWTCFACDASLDFRFSEQGIKKVDHKDADWQLTGFKIGRAHV